MAEHGAEVGVDWVSGLVLHEGDADWHPWDEAVYGPRPGSDDRGPVCEHGLYFGECAVLGCPNHK